MWPDNPATGTEINPVSNQPGQASRPLPAKKKSVTT